MDHTEKAMSSEVYYSEEAIDDLYAIIKEEKPKVVKGFVKHIPDPKPSNQSRTAILSLLGSSNERRHTEYCIHLAEGESRLGPEPDPKVLYSYILFDVDELEKVFSGAQELLPLHINSENPYFRAVSKWRLKRGI